jgi:hypothetical protein
VVGVDILIKRGHFSPGATRGVSKINKYTGHSVSGAIRGVSNQAINGGHSSLGAPRGVSPYIFRGDGSIWVCIIKKL